jgi:predicted RNase H-like HicB family nuclease
VKLVIRISKDEKGEYRAWCPALPGCVARGRSQEEAKAHMGQAVFGYLASLNVALPTEHGRTQLVS